VPGYDQPVPPGQNLGSIGIRRSRSSIRKLALTPTRPRAPVASQILTRLARGVLLNSCNSFPLVPKWFCFPDTGARGLWVHGLFDKQRNT
jgi:hypothetical protein